LHPDLLRKLLDDVAAGRLDTESALGRLAHLPFEELSFAKLDHHRALRCGLPEVIFGEGKTPEQVEEIFVRLAAIGDTVLASRVTPEAATRVLQRVPDAAYDALSRTILLRPRPVQGGDEALVAIVCAGTADLPVAEEARVTLRAVGVRTEAFVDVGVAGLHRLLAGLPRLRDATVLIVVAGMEGALPSVVGGLVRAPVIAVPTSVGYGASFGGVAALLAMLNSCAAGVTVVNIDNGFGAAVHAARIIASGRPKQDR
jgi:NCAIR mutase (PurE)-related protein